jgi:hypothetical protein
MMGHFVWQYVIVTYNTFYTIDSFARRGHCIDYVGPAQLKNEEVLPWARKEKLPEVCLKALETNGVTGSGLLQLTHEILLKPPYNLPNDYAAQFEIAVKRLTDPGTKLLCAILTK